MLAFIPEIGTKMKLQKDWTFDLHCERRNKDILVADGRSIKRGPRNNYKSYKRTLPAGSEFIVDRIYVRQGAKDFSSVTLLLTNTTDKNLTRQAPFKTKGNQHYGRFWVKLYDFNDAGFEIIQDATKTDDSPSKLIKGEIMTMGQFRPSSKHPKYWVKFEHPDPELCFDDFVRTRRLNNESSTNPNFGGDRYEIIRSEKLDGWLHGETYYALSPKYYVHSLVPGSWYEKHKNHEKFKKLTENPYLKVFPKASKSQFPDQFVTSHPLEGEINIPRQKKDRLPLGIQNDKTKLENIPIAGGALTICRVEE